MAVGRTYSYLSGRSRKILNPQTHPDVLAYLANLASSAGSSVEWFLDGDDTWPSGVPLPIEASGSVPVRSYLPLLPGESEVTLGVIERPNAPAGASYYRMAEARRPYLCKLDDLLIVPVEQARSGVIVLVESSIDGARDLFATERKGGKIEIVQLDDSQIAVPDEWELLGVVVEVRRILTGGLMVAYECEAGLSPTMLTM